MRAFPVPVQVTERERLIGGMLDIRQLIYIIVGVALGGAALFMHIHIFFRLLIFFALAAAGCYIAFTHVLDMDVDLYLFRWVKWRLSQRVFYMGRRD